MVPAPISGMPTLAPPSGCPDDETLPAKISVCACAVLAHTVAAASAIAIRSDLRIKTPSIRDLVR